MLAYVLSLAVGLGSLAIYMAAFFFPEVHRKNDFIWSGVGLFYALVLWACAGRITGGVLLGQLAGVTLLGWSMTQTLSLRRQLTPRLSQQTELPSAEEVKNTVQDQVSNSSLLERISQVGKRFGGSATAAKDRLQQNLSSENQRPSQDDVNSKVQIIDKRTPIPNQSVGNSTTELTTDDTESVTESVPEVVQTTSLEPDQNVETTVPESSTLETSEGNQEGAVSEPIRPHPPDPEIVEAAIRDAEQKHQEASPPVADQPENPSPS